MSNQNKVAIIQISVTEPKEAESFMTGHKNRANGELVHLENINGLVNLGALITAYAQVRGATTFVIPLD